MNNQPGLVSAKQADDPLKMDYVSADGQKVRLSPRIVQDFLTSGGGTITTAEVVMFLNLCKYQRLNPYLREAYIIKYGNKPATIVVGKETFTKRAKRNADYRGFQAGIITQNSETGAVEYRTGTFYLPRETVVGGWAKVFVNGWDTPIEAQVSMAEYVGRKSDGEINSQWQGKPATMIRKVALVQALREAFPEDFAGMYDSAEISDATMEPLPTDPVPLDDTGAPQHPPQERPQEQPEEYDPLA